MTARQASDGVGPVLQPTPLARAVVAAMEEENDGVVVHDEGAYLRVLGPRVCPRQPVGGGGPHRRSGAVPR